MPNTRKKQYWTLPLLNYSLSQFDLLDTLTDLILIHLRQLRRSGQQTKRIYTSFIFASFAAWSLVRNKDLQVYRLGTNASMPQTCSEHMPLPKQARNKGVHYYPDQCNQYKICQLPTI